MINDIEDKILSITITILATTAAVNADKSNITSSVNDLNKKRRLRCKKIRHNVKKSNGTKYVIG